MYSIVKMYPGWTLYFDERAKGKKILGMEGESVDLSIEIFAEIWERLVILFGR
jgi:hypothetical protein